MPSPRLVTSFDPYDEFNRDTILAYQPYEGDEEEQLDGKRPGPPDDPTRVLLPQDDHTYLWSTLRKYPESASLEHRTYSTKTMSRRTRVWKICFFIGIELVWLGFALFTSFHIFVVDSGNFNMSLPGGLTMTHTALLRSAISVVGIVFQLVALLPVAEITIEIYSCEWMHIFTHEERRLTRVTDRVSTLTSSFREKLRHLLDRRSSHRYRIAFSVTLLSLLLQTTAPGALTISSQDIGFDTSVSIGILNDTDPSLWPKLELGASRFEYSNWIENSTETFNLGSNDLLYGMPSRDFLGLNTRLEYQSDAVKYQFECQWIPPTYIDGDTLIDSSWSFGGDMSASFDYFALPTLDDNQVTWIYGLWPLMITTGSGANNGSFAWLVIGGIPSGQKGTPIDVSSIPSESRTHNDTGWVDLLGSPQPSWYSTEASILFCDPHMNIVTVQATLNGQQLSANVLQSEPVGNMNYSGASLMLGRSINGMPWDSAIDLAAAEYVLSTLAVKFALEQTSNSPTIFAPLPLSNLTANLQSYTQVAGANVYLSGSFGSTRVPAQSFRSIDRLVCSWPQWGVSIGLFIIIALLLAIIVIAEGSGKKPLVPLTVGAVASVLESELTNIRLQHLATRKLSHLKDL